MGPPAVEATVGERKWSAYGRSAGMKLAQLGVQSPLLFFPRTILTLRKQKVIRSMRRVGLLHVHGSSILRRRVLSLSCRILMVAGFGGLGALPSRHKH